MTVIKQSTKPPIVRDYTEQARSRMNQTEPKIEKLDTYNVDYWKNHGKWTAQDAAEYATLRQIFSDVKRQVLQGPFPIGLGQYEAIVDALDQVDEMIERINFRHKASVHEMAPSGALLPNGTRIGGGTHTGPGGIGGPGMGGGVPSLPGQFGGRFGGLGDRSGRGPGGSQFLPGLGFFPGAGPGPGGSVGHGIGGFGPGMGDTDRPPGPWDAPGGFGSFKPGSGGTGRQPGGGGGNRPGDGSYRETGGRGDRSVGGLSLDGRGVGIGDTGEGSTPAPGPTQTTPVPTGPSGPGPSQPQPSPSTGPTPSKPSPPPTTPTPSQPKPKEPEPVPDDPNPPNNGEGNSDEWEGGGGTEGPAVKRGGPYFVPRGGGMHAGRRSVSVASTGLTYLDFLHKGVDPGGDGWGGNNPVVTPAIKPSDLFKPADDSTGPYNPKGTDYRPAPDDPSPGGPAGAVGRVATRVRVRQG